MSSNPTTHKSGNQFAIPVDQLLPFSHAHNTLDINMLHKYDERNWDEVGGGAFHGAGQRSIVQWEPVDEACRHWRR